MKLTVSNFLQPSILTPDSDPLFSSVPFSPVNLIHFLLPVH